MQAMVEDYTLAQKIVLSTIVNLLETKIKTFDYDESFSEYTVDHNFDIWIYGDEKDAVQLFNDIHIEYAKIGKILCCDEEQRIIFVALGVFDGGVATVDYLCTFFKDCLQCLPNRRQRSNRK